MAGLRQDREGFGDLIVDHANRALRVGEMLGIGQVLQEPGKGRQIERLTGVTTAGAISCVMRLYHCHLQVRPRLDEPQRRCQPRKAGTDHHDSCAVIPFQGW